MNHHRFLGQLLFARPQGVTDREKSKKQNKTRVTSLMMLMMIIIYLWRTTCANFFCTIYLKLKKKKKKQVERHRKDGFLRLASLVSRRTGLTFLKGKGRKADVFYSLSLMSGQTSARWLWFPRHRTSFHLFLPFVPHFSRSAVMSSPHTKPEKKKKKGHRSN